MAEKDDIQEQEQEQEIDLEAKENEVELEVEDDTPPEDRGRKPVSQEVVKELEEDELDGYTEKVKNRLIQM